MSPEQHKQGPCPAGDVTGALLSPEQRTKHCSSCPVVLSLPWGVPLVGSRQDLVLCSESVLQELAWKK